MVSSVVFCVKSNWTTPSFDLLLQAAGWNNYWHWHYRERTTLYSVCRRMNILCTIVYFIVYLIVYRVVCIVYNFTGCLTLKERSEEKRSSEQTESTNCLCLHDWINRNKETDLKEQHDVYCFTLFLCGGPCHLSSFKQCSGALFSSENSSFINLWKQYIFLSLYSLVINIEFEILLQNFI